MKEVAQQRDYGSAYTHEEHKDKENSAMLEIEYCLDKTEFDQYNDALIAIAECEEFIESIEAVGQDKDDYLKALVNKIKNSFVRADAKYQALQMAYAEIEGISLVPEKSEDSVYVAKLKAIQEIMLKVLSIGENINEGKESERVSSCIQHAFSLAAFQNYKQTRMS